MFKIDDVVMYRRELCKVVDFHKNEINKEMYYILTPLLESTTKTKIQVPVANRANHSRSLITKKEIAELLLKVPSLELIQSRNSNMKNEYASLLNSGSHEALFRIIKTSYLKQQERLTNKKKVGIIDESYFQEAERALYTEIGYVLNMSFEETKDYIYQEIEKSIVK